MWVLGVIAACLFAIAGLAWSGRKDSAQNASLGIAQDTGTAAAAFVVPDQNGGADSSSAASSATVTGGTLIIQDYHSVNTPD